MKVSRTGSGGAVSPAGRPKRSGGKDDAFARELKAAEAAGETPGVVDSPAVAGVDSILALQQVPDAVAGHAHALARRYGEALLDDLDRLRLDLLAGRVPKERLAELAHRMRQQRQRCDDPRLDEIIAEIELRAEVEIAKLTRPR